MVFDFSSYKTYLKSEYLSKSQRNPSYSLRSFADQLGVAHSTLSEIFAGKKNLSLERAAEIAMKLGLKEKESDYFCLLVQKDTAKTGELQNALQERLNNLNPRHKNYDLSIDAFKMISDWHHMAILTLCNVDGFVLSPETASKRLGISRLEADLAIERLVRLELLEACRDGSFQRIKDNVLANATVSNEGLKSFHRQYLEKAIQSLVAQTPQERLSHTENFALDPSLLKEADTLMDEFFDKMLKLTKRSKKKTHVYNLCCHFFNLTPNGGKKS